MEKKITVIIIIFIILLIALFSTFIFKDKEGNIKNVEIVIGASEIYSKEEIQEAIDIVLESFKSFPANLDKIWYDEEKSKNEIDEWAKQYDAEEAIILYSNFTTYFGNIGPLNPNSKYEYWNWILTRSNNEKWQLRTSGY